MAVTSSAPQKIPLPGQAAPGGPASQPGGLTRLWLWLNPFKANKFKQLDNALHDHPEALSLAKALWLTRRGLACARWGHLLKARSWYQQAIAEKKDFYPAYFHLATAYRETTRVTGHWQLLHEVEQMLENMPKVMGIMGTQVSLEMSGAALHAEWSCILQMLGHPQAALEHLELALLCQRRYLEMEQPLRDFFEEVGCSLSSLSVSYLERLRASLRAEVALCSE
ncbi:MAG: hypothetical protein V1806_01720 [Pseudomonadota bacterium]